MSYSGIGLLALLFNGVHSIGHSISDSNRRAKDMQGIMEDGICKGSDRIHWFDTVGRNGCHKGERYPNYNNDRCGYKHLLNGDFVFYNYSKECCISNETQRKKQDCEKYYKKYAEDNGFKFYPLAPKFYNHPNRNYKKVGTDDIYECLSYRDKNCRSQGFLFCEKTGDYYIPIRDMEYKDKVLDKIEKIKNGEEKTYHYGFFRDLPFNYNKMDEEVDEIMYEDGYVRNCLLERN